MGAVLAGVAVLLLVDSRRHAAPELLAHLKLLIPVSLMFLLGLVDDFRTLTARVKFSSQALIGLLTFELGMRVNLTNARAVGVTADTLIEMAATVIWVLLITNAFNLIDGLDGLAAGCASCTAVTILAVSLMDQNHVSALLAALLLGALTGFLRYNFNPATIFLGDCGSLMLGSLIATLSLVGQSQQKSSTLVMVALPVVACGLPIVDTTLAIIRRFLRNQPLFGADRGHIHHRLLDLGFSHRGAVLTLYAVSGGLGMLSILLLYPPALGVVITVAVIGFYFGLQKLGYPEFKELGHMARTAFRQRATLPNNLAVRQAATDLQGASSLAEICAILECAFENNEFESMRLTVGKLQDPQKLGPRSDFAKVKEISLFEHTWRKKDCQVFAHRPAWKMELDCSPSIDYPVTFQLLRRENGEQMRLDLQLVSGALQEELRAATGRVLALEAALIEQRVPVQSAYSQVMSRAASSNA